MDILLKVKKHILDRIIDINSNIEKIDAVNRFKREEEREFLLKMLIEITNIECEHVSGR